ncbi:MAG: serine/threonine protein kinase [Candidatus Eisenbacteria bacterium]|nr:serine/threonine protein kinase [Candidatus Eisenbacteria bacterium]
MTSTLPPPPPAGADGTDSPRTDVLLQRDRPAVPEREDLDERLHLARMCERFAGAAAAPVVFRSWQVLRKLGQGGMGAVYLALDPALGRRVALKLIGGGSDVSPPRDSVREARALAAVDHPNIIHVHRVDERVPGTVVIEMEYIEGATLRAWIAARPRHWREIVAVVAAAGDGLTALHRAGIIHRDVKPDNILIGAAGEVKLADLGLAVASDRPPFGEEHRSGSLGAASPLQIRFTADGGLLGTHGYIAPEVFAGAEATPSSDLFGLATTLHEALFGVLPFQGDTPAELAAAIRGGALQIPNTALSRPNWLIRALRRALAADPRQRPATVADFVQSLRRGLDRRRLAVMLAGLVAASSALSFLGWALGPVPVDPCASAGAPAAGLLGPQALRALDTGAAPESTRALLSAALTARRDAWIAADIGLCVATQHRPLLDLRTRIREARQRRCLDDTLGVLAAIIAAIGPDDPSRLARRLADTITAIEAIPTCQDPALAHWQPSPDPMLRDELARALRLELEGAHGPAEALAREIDQHPKASPYDRAEALYRLGHVLAAERRISAATAALSEAQHLALATGHDDLYCRAAAHRAKLASVIALTPDRARDDLQIAAACVERLGSRSPHLRADLLEARGLLADTAGELDVAIIFHEQALALRTKHLGEDHLETSQSHQNLANALTERNRDGDRNKARTLRHCHRPPPRSPRPTQPSGG